MKLSLRKRNALIWLQHSVTAMVCGGAIYAGWVAFLHILIPSDLWVTILAPLAWIPSWTLGYYLGKAADIRCKINEARAVASIMREQEVPHE